MVNLPNFVSTRPTRRSTRSSQAATTESPVREKPIDETTSSPATTAYTPTSKTVKKHTTAKRTTLALMYLLSLIFLILVLIGNINNKPVIRSIYFLKLDLSNIIPVSVPNAVLINSIARTIGLHDFYQVGVWNFCEGYNTDGITNCSKTKTLYWFNPVEIILNELLSGATIALPANITSALKIVRIASHWMFALYIVGACLLFLCIFVTPWSATAKPRYYHRGSRFFFRFLPITILSFAAAFCVTVASVVATVMFVIFRNVFEGQTEVNIKADLGLPMLAFMWIASGFALIGFIWELGNCCCVCCCSGSRKHKKEMKAAKEAEAQGTTA